MSLKIEAAEILRELVAIPTPSSVSNLPLLHWVSNFVTPRGWQVEILPYRDEQGSEKANLIARPKCSNQDALLDLAFLCHTDTVPYAATWAKALKLEEQGGMLHGCGSCDVKGSLACFLAAVSQLSADKLRPQVALILTADEEIGCKGVEQLLATTELRIGSALVSEPTSLRPGIAGKGYGLARITVEGREAHSAFPKQGVSAISIAARLIVGIEAHFEAGPDGSGNGAGLDALFDPPRTTLNIGVIEGGTAKNIIPGRCSFLVEWRAIPGEDPTFVLGELRSLVIQAEIAEPKATIQVQSLRAEAGFSPAASGELLMRLSSLPSQLPREPVGISFGSEASRVARIADEVIVIGPGDMRTAHSDRECVPIKELELWTSILASLLSH